MSFMCEICGKKPHMGNIIVRRGLAKKKGGIGLHTTGVTRRRFLPNLQRIRIKVSRGVRTARVCTNCIRSGRVTKA